jgi:hypothetical protein
MQQGCVVMIPIPSRTTVQQQQAIAVLLDYLTGAVCRWPGSDGLTVEDALLGYSQAAAAGWVPDCEELLRRHPDMASVLRELLAVPKSPE